MPRDLSGRGFRQGQGPVVHHQHVIHPVGASGGQRVERRADTLTSQLQPVQVPHRGHDVRGAGALASA